MKKNFKGIFRFFTKMSKTPNPAFETSKQSEKERFSTSSEEGTVENTVKNDLKIVRF